MNHKIDFVITLKHIYMFATEKGIFEVGGHNEISSTHPWEKLIFKTGGFVE